MSGHRSCSHRNEFLVAHCFLSRGPLAAILPLCPRRLQFPVPLGLNLLLMPGEHVLRRDVTDGAVQTNVVVTEAGRRFFFSVAAAKELARVAEGSLFLFLFPRIMPTHLFQIQIQQTFRQHDLNTPRNGINPLTNILSQRNQQFPLSRVHFQQRRPTHALTLAGKLHIPHRTQ
jgi:hypothetical protein